MFSLAGTNWHSTAYASPGPWWYSTTNIGWTPDSLAFVFPQQSSDASDVVRPVNLVALFTDGGSSKTIAADIYSSLLYDAYNSGLNQVQYALNSTTGRIAYARGLSHADHVLSILLTNVNRTQPATLLQQVDDVQDISWSPDGQYVAASGIVTTGDKHQGAVDVRLPVTYAADGTPQFTYAKDAQLVWAHEDGSQVHVLHYQLIHILQWLPEQKALLYIAEQNNNFQVIVLDLASGKNHAILQGLPEDKYQSFPHQGPAHAVMQQWTAFPLLDGRHIVLRYGFSVPAFGRREWHQGLYLTTWDGQDSHTLIPDGGNDIESWREFEISDVLPSPDGSAAAISFHGGPDGTWDLWLISDNGRRTHLNFTPTARESWPNFTWINCNRF